jgi:hypothetical protein
MNLERPLPVVAATALLGVIAFAALLTGAYMLLAAWTVGSQLGGWVGDVGTAATLIIAAATFLYGGLATAAARDLWLGRPRGQVLGMIVGILAVLASLVVLLVGRTTGEVVVLLAIAAALGVATVIATAIPARDRARGSV